MALASALRRNSSDCWAIINGSHLPLIALRMLVSCTVIGSKTYVF
jgi:hypothetical protein